MENSLVLTFASVKLVSSGMTSPPACGTTVARPIIDAAAVDAPILAGTAFTGVMPLGVPLGCVGGGVFVVGAGVVTGTATGAATAGVLESILARRATWEASCE